MTTLEEKAEKYAEKHCYIEPKMAFLAGYSEGYGDARQIECIPSDEMIIKIINLYNKFGADKIDINFNITSIETIKEKLYNN